jgi:membrane protease YdiL (CAAX protease family)
VAAPVAHARAEAIGGRLRTLFGTVPGPAAWTQLIGMALGLLALSWLADRSGLAAWRVDLGFLLGLGALAGFATAAAEEALFRGVLLKPPAPGQGAIAPAMLSGILFAFWHPFQTFLYHPLWESHAWSWWFLAGTGLLGFACALLTVRTRSLWPAIALHWFVAMGWKTLYGIPSCGPAAAAIC